MKRCAARLYSYKFLSHTDTFVLSCVPAFTSLPRPTCLQLNIYNPSTGCQKRVTLKYVSPLPTSQRPTPSIFTSSICPFDLCTRRTERRQLWGLGQFEKQSDASAGSAPNEKRQFIRASQNPPFMWPANTRASASPWLQRRYDKNGRLRNLRPL